MPIQFHLDESVASSVATALKQRDLDVTTSAEVGLIGSSDEEQLTFALNERRVIITHDDDFLALHNEGAAHAGIIYCSPRSKSIGRIVRGLLLIAEILTPEEMENHVEFL